MRLIRGAVNAVLMATLAKPVARWTVARWRRRVQESAATTIGIPVQQLFETALIEELAPLTVDVQPSPAETLGESAGRGALRTMLITGAVVALVAASVVAIAAVVRRRRETREARAGSAEWVAVPMDASIEEARETLAEATPID